MCYLSGIWWQLEPLERIYGRFPSVNPSAGSLESLNLVDLIYREKTVYNTTHKMTINRPMDHTGET